MEADRKNYYEVLEIETNATPGQIENAYVRARNAYSGDSVALYSLMTPEECQNILSQIEEAYSVLGFPDKRREYDRLRGLNQSLSQLINHGHRSHPTAVVSHTGHVHHPTDAIQYEDFSSKSAESKISKLTAIQKFGLDFKEDPDFDRKIRETSEYTGTFLKEVREYKNVSIERMAELTRVSKTHLISIEADDVKKLPAEVYVRGYIYQYAKVLKLDPDKVAASYILHVKKLKLAK